MSVTPNLGSLDRVAQETRKASTAAPEQGGLSWQREMERAQMSTWLAHEPPSHSTPNPSTSSAPTAATHGQPRSPVAPAPRRSGDPASAHPALAAAAIGKAAPSAHSGPTCAATAPADVPRTSSFTRPAAGSSAIRDTEPGRRAVGVNTVPASTGNMPLRPISLQPSPLAAPPATPGPARGLDSDTGLDPTDARAAPTVSTERPPARVHIEWRDGQAHVWLGVDASLADRRRELAATVTASVRAQGLEVASLTCNGRPWSEAITQRLAGQRTNAAPHRPPETPSSPNPGDSP